MTDQPDAPAPAASPRKPVDTNKVAIVGVVVVASEVGALPDDPK